MCSCAGRPTIAGALLQQNMSALMTEVKGQAAQAAAGLEADGAEEPDAYLEFAEDDEAAPMDQGMETEEEEPLDEEDLMADMDIGERGSARELPPANSAEAKEADEPVLLDDDPDAADDAGARNC